MDANNKLLEYLKNPLIAAVLAVVVGFALGLAWGWKIDPVEFYDATPEVLRADYQEDYLRMTIDSFLVNSDTEQAFRRWQNLGPVAQERLNAISQAPGKQDKVAIDAFSTLIASTTAIPPSTEVPGDVNQTDGKTPSNMRYALIIVGLLVVGAVGFLAMRVLRPLSSNTNSPVQQAMRHAQAVEKTDYEGLGLATPITQSMTTYVLGDDLYDESFSIESQAGEFLGEYGVGISDTIGVGEPKKVTALEIWLFDKNDIKTATKVLMSKHAYNNPEIVQRLEAKGELVLVSPQEPVKLETETLQILVTPADLTYGSGHLPEDSYFERITLELAVWPKQAPAQPVAPAAG